MAKESIIIFVYDTELVQKEEDDPASAILYFHPTWVSDQQKAALCGQIIGTLRCIKNTIAKPKIVSLQTGKFLILENGRYLLVVGTDRNITDWILKHRAKTLYSLVNFFHKDFESLAALYRNNSFSAKLYHIFETYLKMLVFGGSIFSHIPMLPLPKSASNVFIEAIHILECCQAIDHVLGGAMMYHNKVVATQLSSDLTKRLVLTDPYRIKCPAETAEVTFDLPIGVQLLQVYVSNKEYCKLLELSIRNRNIFQYLTNKSIKRSYPQPHDTPIVSAMKRDQSLLFTSVPEEGSDHSCAISDHPFVPTSKKSRPKFLKLKSISIDEPKPIKPALGTPLCGQRSVCSTPMTELKKFVLQNPLSICRNDMHESYDETEKIDSASASSKEVVSRKSVPYVKVTLNSLAKKTYSSLIDLKAMLNSISKNPSQYSSVNSKSFLDLDLSPKKPRHITNFKTITDPTFPIFTQEGTVISHSYYDDCITRNLELVEKEIKSMAVNHIDPFRNFDCTLIKIEPESNKVIANILDVPKGRTKEHRKSLTLPLKSLTNESECATNPSITRKYSSGVQLTPLMSKLSMLAFEERSSGFCSRDNTPSDNRGLTPTQQNLLTGFTKLKLNKEIKTDKIDDEMLQKCTLFVCGQQDMVLMILLKEDGCAKANTVKNLWEICTEHLSKLEKQLVFCMEAQSGAKSHESEPYSYLCLDSEWDTVKRGGPWGTNDLSILNYLHRDFEEVQNVTEILIRGGDSIIYAHHCGPTEVFYHESANPNAGLPPPADPMGLVQLKAKRRLERDHSIILL